MIQQQVGIGLPGAWYVVFIDGERPHWWWPLCRRGFRHVLAFGYSVHAEAWLIYDVTMARTYVRAIPQPLLADFLDALPAGRRILRYEPPADPKPPAFRLGFWCAPAIAHLVGLPTRALRPQALFRDLKAHGAVAAFEERPDDADPRPAQGRPRRESGEGARRTAG